MHNITWCQKWDTARAATGGTRSGGTERSELGDKPEWRSPTEIFSHRHSGPYEAKVVGDSIQRESKTSLEEIPKTVEKL